VSLVLHWVSSEEMHIQFDEHRDKSLLLFSRERLYPYVFLIYIFAKFTSFIVCLTDQFSFADCFLPGTLCKDALNSETYYRGTISKALIAERK
jgi:hypothetical protein